MSSEKQGAETRTPPYMSYARFEGFIGGLHGKPLPPRIDRTVMSRMSGSEQSQLRVTMRFLGLIRGDDDLVTDEMRELVAAHSTPTWPERLATVVQRAYLSVTANLDDAATQGQLDERFRERGGLVGSAVVKAVRFYLSAMNAAGLTVSPHFKGSTVVPTNGGGAKKPRKPRESTGDLPVKEKDRGAAAVPEDMEEVSVPVPGKSVKVWFPKNLTQKEFDYTMATLKAWRELKEE